MSTSSIRPLPVNAIARPRVIRAAPRPVPEVDRHLARLLLPHRLERLADLRERQDVGEGRLQLVAAVLDELPGLVVHPGLVGLLEAERPRPGDAAAPAPPERRRLLGRHAVHPEDAAAGEAVGRRLEHIDGPGGLDHDVEALTAGELTHPVGQRVRRRGEGLVGAKPARLVEAGRAPPRTSTWRAPSSLAICANARPAGPVPITSTRRSRTGASRRSQLECLLEDDERARIDRVEVPCHDLLEPVDGLTSDSSPSSTSAGTSVASACSAKPPSVEAKSPSRSPGRAAAVRRTMSPAARFRTRAPASTTGRATRGREWSDSRAGRTCRRRCAGRFRRGRRRAFAP